MRIFHTFTQSYDNWDPNLSFDPFTCRTNTFDIIEAMDLLEADVFKDRDFNLANEMLHGIGIRTP